MMNGKRINLLNEILTEQMNHWMLFPAVLTVMGLPGFYAKPAGPHVILWALCGLCPFLLFLIRYWSRRFVLQLFLHLAVAAPVVLFFTTQSREFLLFAACVVGYLGHSVYLRLGSDAPYTNPIRPVYGALIAVVGILLQHYRGETGWDLYYVVSFVFALGLYALVLYNRQYQAFLNVNESSTGYLPASEIFRSGFKLMLGYVITGGIIMLFFGSLGDLDGVFVALGQRLRRLLHNFFSSVQPPASDKDIPQDVGMPAADFPAQTSQTQNDLLWRILELALVVLLIVFVIYFLVRLLPRLIRFLRSRLAARFQWGEGDRTDKKVVDLREKCADADQQNKSQRRSLAEFLSPGQRIRKLYKKHILDSAMTLTKGDTGQLRFLTPRECGQRLSEEQMAVIYEQVRYSDREATPEMLRSMKNALRKE